jgi:hypothetical protein
MPLGKTASSQQERYSEPLPGVWIPAIHAGMTIFLFGLFVTH